MSAPLQSPVLDLNAIAALAPVKQLDAFAAVGSGVRDTIHLRRTAVCRNPSIESGLHRLMHHPRVRSWKWRPKTALVKRSRIIDAVDVKHGHRTRWRE